MNGTKPATTGSVEIAKVARSVVLAARGSKLAGYGWVCLNPEMLDRLDIQSGDTVWLANDGTPAPFSIESHEDVEHGQAWLNPREMAAMGVRDGEKLTAAGAYNEISSLLEGLK
jgi:formylmethanofuran dehydrogenase subunit D